MLQLVGLPAQTAALLLELLLLALLVEIGYTRSMKKRQERIFELREEIAMADKEIDKDEAA